MTKSTQKDIAEIMLERFEHVIDLLRKLETRGHHMGKSLDNLTAAVAANNSLIQQAVDAITKGGTVVGEDPVAVQALADQITKDDAALASVLGPVVPPTP